MAVIKTLLTWTSMVTAGAAAVKSYDNEWVKLQDGAFSGREGLMAVSVGDTIFMSGGRDSAGVGFESDVWASENGTEWQLLANDQFGDRAYHSMLEMNGDLYIMAGQTFSKFYNDVWKSSDEGSTWTVATNDAPWPERAGQAAVVTSAGEMIIAGGCYNDESGTRSFRNDVYASKDGVTWEQRTADAPWQARSGPRLVEFKGKLFLVAGEVGFTPSTQLGDIWSSEDGGATWSLEVEVPEFSARSGHGVVVTGETMLVIAGWPQLHDLWSSTDGVSFKQESNLVWNCDGIVSSVSQIGCGKYDFWSLVHNDKLVTLGGSGAFSTFGKLYGDSWAMEL